MVQHSKIGELIGKAVYEAVVEALKKQNGVEMLEQK
jgi:adenosylcobinamide amidohydrolase